jgi:hypothetical protein
MDRWKYGRREERGEKGIYVPTNIAVVSPRGEIGRANQIPEIFLSFFFL